MAGFLLVLFSALPDFKLHFISIMSCICSLFRTNLELITECQEPHFDLQVNILALWSLSLSSCLCSLLFSSSFPLPSSCPHPVSSGPLSFIVVFTKNDLFFMSFKNPILLLGHNSNDNYLLF